MFRPYLFADLHVYFLWLNFQFLAVFDWSNNEMQAVWYHLKCFSIFFWFICLAVAQRLTESWYLLCQYNHNGIERLGEGRVHSWEFVLTVQKELS